MMKFNSSQININIRKNISCYRAYRPIYNNCHLISRSLHLSSSHIISPSTTFFSQTQKKLNTYQHNRQYTSKSSSSLLLSSSSSSPPSITYPPPSSYSNVTDGIRSKINMNLHLQPGHPINIIKKRIKFYFDKRAEQLEKQSPNSTEVHRFELIDNLSPIVSVESNFDDLLFPKDHVGRSKSDTFYFNENTLLRTHTSAHQNEYLKQGLSNFLIVGDCYRRDEIDSSHYPVFHQIEGVRVFNHDVNKYNRNSDGVELVVNDLKSTLEGLVKYLFSGSISSGSELKIRWVEGYFPFTHPSLEMEIYYQDRWLEVLGCGVIQYPILDQCSSSTSSLHGKNNGWAFGVGLERLAMILFEIPDIRLFWTNDQRFTKQFDQYIHEDLNKSNGKFHNIKFEPYSKYPSCYKDISFWITNTTTTANASSTTSSSSPSSPSSSPSSSFHDNDFCCLVRELAGDIVEQVKLVDEFVHPKTQQTSKCYRITYRHLDRNLTNEEVDKIQDKVKEGLTTKMGLKLR